MSAIIQKQDSASQEKSSAVSAGRRAMAEWERAQPDNYYESDRDLQNILEFYWGEEELSARKSQLSRFGHEAATIVDAAVRRNNLNENLPRLDRFNAIGERTEDVAFSPDYHLAGQYIYGSGVMAAYAEPANNLLNQALFYLSSYNGEAGHNCPLACTAGIIKTLKRAGSEELKAKYLPRLLDPNYSTRLHGAQFLTEIQGGSDVGLNACTATPLDQERGTWLINGEKWFCSNVTADLALITARPAGAAPGTKGLGLFLVPRKLDDGSTNGLYIRRLKDKLGTRSMATGEVDFRDAVAYQIGSLERGFNQAMEFVVNTSRLYNATGSAAAARRAYVVAWTYAQHRQAFGTPISGFPLVQETLAEMRSEVMALTSGSLYLAHLLDEMESGRADDTAAPFFRVAVNLNKYLTSINATSVIRRGIEVLGGNGAMETFSVLPRLLRDCVIFEAWEGAHNTLLAQVLRDIHRYRVHEPFCTHLVHLFSSLQSGQMAELHAQGLGQVESLRSELNGLLKEDELTGSIAFRRAAERMMYLFYAACMAREAERGEARNGNAGRREALELFWHRRVAATLSMPDYLKRISQVSSAL
ncbi:MAG TPA: acyl-CoA dehydrogenase family protein [Blastocatellia bacterium]|nr:acyl-CoA dehydrogenase family protein [Blastocatellia bacterium]